MSPFYSRTSQMRHALQKMVLYKFPVVLQKLWQHAKTLPPASDDPQHSGLELLRYHHEIADCLTSWEQEQFVEVQASSIIDIELIFRDPVSAKRHTRERLAQEIGKFLLDSGTLFIEEYRPNFNKVEFKAQVLVLRGKPLGEE